MKTQEVLEAHGLDFNISKEQLFATVGGAKVPTPYFGLFNDKTGQILNSVKASYTVSQNKDIVEMVLKGMKPFGNKLNVQNAGSLDGGKKVFLQLGIEGDAKVGSDILKRYVTIVDSNDSSTGLAVGIGDLTMSCQNQFFHFNKTAQHKFRHTATIEDKIKTLPALIQASLAESLRMIQVYNEMAKSPLTKHLADKLVRELVGLDRLASGTELSEASSKKVNAMEALYANIEHEMADKGENLWGLHSGVTRWTTHTKSAPRRDNGRLEGIMTGTNYGVNQKSLGFVLEQL